MQHHVKVCCYGLVVDVMQFHSVHGANDSQSLIKILGGHVDAVVGVARAEAVDPVLPERGHGSLPVLPRNEAHMLGISHEERQVALAPMGVERAANLRWFSKTEWFERGNQGVEKQLVLIAAVSAEYPDLDRWDRR